MAGRQRLDRDFFVSSGGHASNAGPLTIAAHRVAQTVIDRLRIQERINEGFDKMNEALINAANIVGRYLFSAPVAWVSGCSTLILPPSDT